MDGGCYLGLWSASAREAPRRSRQPRLQKTLHPLCRLGQDPDEVLSTHVRQRKAVLARATDAHAVWRQRLDRSHAGKTSKQGQQSKRSTAQGRGSEDAGWMEGEGDVVEHRERRRVDGHLCALCNPSGLDDCPSTPRSPALKRPRSRVHSQTACSRTHVDPIELARVCSGLLAVVGEQTASPRWGAQQASPARDAVAGITDPARRRHMARHQLIRRANPSGPGCPSAGHPGRPAESWLSWHRSQPERGRCMRRTPALSVCPSRRR